MACSDGPGTCVVRVLPSGPTILTPPVVICVPPVSSVHQVYVTFGRSWTRRVTGALWQAKKSSGVGRKI